VPELKEKLREMGELLRVEKEDKKLTRKEFKEKLKILNFQKKLEINSLNIKYFTLSEKFQTHKQLQ